MFVGRITNKDTQKLKVVVKNGGETKEQTYVLTGLTLEPKMSTEEATVVKTK